MVEALCFVHDRKVIHRDLKPSNIFIKDDVSISIGKKFKLAVTLQIAICVKFNLKVILEWRQSWEI